MTRHSHSRSVLALLVGRLIEARSARERDQALLDGAMELSGSTAGAVYGRGRGGWYVRLSSADQAELPRRERVAALLEGELSPDALPSSELVVSHGRLPWALTLGGVHAADVQDALEGLLVVRSIAGCEDSPDEELPPVPHRG